MAVKTRSALKTDLTTVLDTPVDISELRQFETNMIDSATFPADLATVAFSGDYDDLTNTPAGGGGSVDDTAFGVGWNGVTDDAPSKNAVYDKVATMDTTISGKVGTSLTLTGGTGIATIGDLSANRTIALSSATQDSLALADSAIQSDDLATVATTGSYTDLTDDPISNVAYGVSWSGDLGVPTKGVLYTKIEALDAAKADSSHNHAASETTSGTFADARIAESSVTQHEAALTVTESQISDLGTYLEAADVADHITSDTTEAGGGSVVANIVSISQAAYDALSPPDADTWYLISG